MSNEQYVKRFSKFIVIGHWVNAVSFIMLFLTGLPLYLGVGFNWIGSIFGGHENAQIIHRVFAVTFLLPTPFIILTDFKGFKHWTKQAFGWTKDDFRFLAFFPLELIGKAGDKIPKQDFFNGGQKLNSVLTIFGAMTMVFTGFIMWFDEYFRTISFALVQWCYPIHDLGMALMVAVIIGHVYLSVGHPASRPSFIGMTRGVVPVSYAKAHHGKWYDELKAKGEIK